jgi:hypothetical protein
VFATLQFVPTPRAQVFANTLWLTSAGRIGGFTYDPGALAPLLVGLDYPLMAQSFPDLSDLDVGRFVQTAGVNLRLANAVVLTSTLEFNRYDDSAPWLFDASGRYVTFTTGLNWVF